MPKFMAPSYRRSVKVGLLYGLALLIMMFIMTAGRIPTAQAVNIGNGDVGAIVTALRNIPNDGSGNLVLDLTANGTYAVGSSFQDFFGATAFPALYGRVTINGNGATLTRAAGAAPFRFFFLANSTATLTITNLTINGGVAPGQAGGAILNFDGNINLINVNLNNNLATTLGGAVYHQGGTLSLSAVTANNNSVNGNSSTSGGAFGIFSGTVTIGNSNFSNNSASPGTGSVIGGAVYMREGSLTVYKSFFAGNNATSGGAIGIDSATVVVSGSTFNTNNGTGTVTSGGGAIFNLKGTLNVDQSTFTANTAAGGGAIFSAINTILNVANSTFTANVVKGAGADSGGGAISSVAQATIFDSLFTNNTAPGGGKTPDGGFGGAVFSHQDPGTNPTIKPSMVIDGCTFSGNTAPSSTPAGGFGGALYNYGPIAMTINKSSFSTNSAPNGGGVLYNEGGNVTITNDFFGNNSGSSASGGALANAGSPSFGGLNVTMNVVNSTFVNNSAGGGAAIINAASSGNPSSLTVVNSTFSGNSASGIGGGFTISNNKDAASGSVATVTLRNSIISGSIGGNCTSINGASPFATGASNIVTGDPTGCGTGTVVVPNAGLAANADFNGGSVANLALVAGSPAINVGNTTFCPSTDVRGFGRVGQCDIGAFEFGAAGAPPPASYNVTLLPAPVRVAIATPGSGTLLAANGANAPANPPAASSVSLAIGGTNGIPATASGVVGVLTNISCTGGGNFRFWTGTTVPNAVNLNVPGAQSSLNLSTNFTTQLDATGNVNLGLAGTPTTQCGYAVDVIGFLNAPAAGGGGFALLGAPVRLSIATPGSGTLLTASGNLAPDNAPAASSVSIQARGTNGIPADATGIFGVLTNIGCSGGGNLRLWPGTAVPNAVNLNVPGANPQLNLSTGFVAALGANGAVTLGLAGAAGVQCGYAVDVIGYISPTGSKIALLPTSVRVASTLGTGQVPLVSSGANAPVAGGIETLTFKGSGLNGIPSGATGLIGVFTNVGCSAGGNFRFWSSAAVPNAVNLNVPGVNPRLNLSTGFVTSLSSSANGGSVNLGFASSAFNQCGFAVDVIGYLV